jgi:hypothetical protein
MTNPYSFATFDVEPDAGNGTTTITVTQHSAAAGSASYLPKDTFTLVRPLQRASARGSKVA